MMPWPIPTYLFGLLTFLGLASSYSTTRPIPITVLSGFLGAGKTTLLQILLQNNQGLRIAVIVNDVASVNIDSKLVAKENQAAGMVELQNGCACCSQAEELLASVAELVTLSDLRADDEAFDHIVIECSGVADPKGVRAQFQQASLYQMPLMERVELDTMVTLVDAASFLEYLQSDKIASPRDTPELFYREGETPDPGDTDEDEDDSWPDGTSIPASLRALLNPSQSNNRNAFASSEESVAALLVSQTETADVVLLNKIDLATPETIRRIQSVVRACCPAETRVETCSYANVDGRNILGVAGGRGVVLSGVVDDHREAVKSSGNLLVEATKDLSHSHDHHSAGDKNGVSHETQHGSDRSLEHDHSHSHSHDHACDDTNVSDHSHSHSQEHACDDPECTDPSHQHPTTHAGIATFVYQARRPFHPGRLVTFLRKLPIRMGLPEGDRKKEGESLSDPVLSGILRSKGFCWCADSNRVAYFWSQAGPSFELSKVGSWWATLPREQWPPSAVESILADFDDREHKEIRLASGASVGDRRQEVVLIGTTLGTPQNQALVRDCLDRCLLQDDEWQEYCAHCNDESLLRSKFPTPLLSRLMTY